MLSFISSSHKIIVTIAVIASLVITGTSTANTSDKAINNSTAAGYTALKLFLEDEQYLTAIRRTKMVLTFSDIDDNSRKLIDSIASTSEQALEDLEKIKHAKPQIKYIDFSDDSISKATFDSLRLTEGKEFLFESGDFEKNLLISQLKVLRVISHLALQIKEKESNVKRQKWLIRLAETYENYYQKVNARITVHIKEKA